MVMVMMMVMMMVVIQKPAFLRYRSRAEKAQLNQHSTDEAIHHPLVDDHTNPLVNSHEFATSTLKSEHRKPEDQERNSEYGLWNIEQTGMNI